MSPEGGPKPKLRDRIGPEVRRRLQRAGDIFLRRTPDVPQIREGEQREPMPFTLRLHGAGSDMQTPLTIPHDPGASPAEYLGGHFRDMRSAGPRTYSLDISHEVPRETITGAWDDMRGAFERNRELRLVLTTRAEHPSIQADTPLADVLSGPPDPELAAKVQVAETVQKLFIDAGHSQQVDVLVADIERRAVFGDEREKSEPVAHAAVLGVSSTEPRLDHLRRHFDRMDVGLAPSVEPDAPLEETLPAALEALPSDKPGVIIIDFAGRPEVSDGVRDMLNTALRERPSVVVKLLTKATDEQKLNVGTDEEEIRDATQEDSDFVARTATMHSLHDALDQDVRGRVSTTVSSRTLGVDMSRFGTWVQRQQEQAAA